ncbi:MAG: lipoprotein-releasing ABC transporter permease subunit [Steroidobacterales bacterium]
MTEVLFLKALCFNAALMFQPLSLFVGLRYVRARRHKFFVSLITWVSLAGVALGVAALIVILSIMNGFEGELRERLLSLGGDARVVDEGAPAGEFERALAPKLRALPGVTGVAPYMELEALAVHLPEMLPVTLRGIDPAQEIAVSDLAPLLVQGTLRALQPGADAVILGHDIAEQLAVTVGDAVTLLVPTSGAGGVPEPRLREFHVGGIFEAGLQDHDSTLILALLSDVRAFAPHAAGARGLRLRFIDALAVGRYMPAVRTAAGRGYLVRDWTEDHASYFRAIRIEKTMMALILLLIVGVAAFNIVAMLVMVVNDKRTDIAILRTFGTPPRSVMAVFVTQGLAIGWFGVAAGVALGLTLAHNVERIVPLLERLFHFHFLDADVYYETRIPAEVHGLDVALIGLAALLLTLLATVYPALRAARTSPADALRYE